MFQGYSPLPHPAKIILAKAKPLKSDPEEERSYFTWKAIENGFADMEKKRDHFPWPRQRFSMALHVKTS